MSSNNNKQTILVTGGCGYCGAHTVMSLIESNLYNVVVIDNISNASPTSLLRIQSILQLSEPIPYYNVDILDKQGLEKVFDAHPDISSVIHFAGLKAVGQSGKIPLDYYNVNVVGTLNLLKVMESRNIRKLVFSSSATVYGEPDKIPIPETAKITSFSTYGRTKVFCEHMIQDLCTSQPELVLDEESGELVKNPLAWKAIILRYFNPVSGDPRGMGEDPRGVPNNLMPYLAKVAGGQLEKLTIYGNDYATRDGTCVRDYLHVVDLAKGHVAALSKLQVDDAWDPEATKNHKIANCRIYNLGSGTGFTVLEMVAAFSRAVGKPLPHVIAGRRSGDVPNLTADPSLANKELNWKSEKTMDEMCEDLWNWQSKNPQGYETK